MIDSKYAKGVLTRVHHNGLGQSLYFYVNRHASIDEIMVDGFFDLANKNRGRPGQIVEADMITAGDWIKVDAADACAEVRVMSMDTSGTSLTVKAISPPMVYDADDDLPAAMQGAPKPKRGPKPRLNVQ